MVAALILIVVVAAAVASIARLAYHVIFRRPLPRVQGTVQVGGLRAPVTLVRDRQGIPTISASGYADACFALGFAHGQDRLWQMEVQRRLASGRLSEVFGSRALSADRLMRRLGLRRVSEAEWHVTHAAGPVREEVQAYVAGVNAAMADRPLPAEFTILRHRPEPWEAEDSLAIGRLLSFSQSVNWEAQLVRMRMLKELGPDLTQALDPVLGAGQGLPLGEPEEAAANLGGDWLDELRAAEDLLALSSWTAASNSWVLAGSRTTTGRPMLANDPHGPIGIPSPWYRVELRFAERRLTGLSFCGAPYLLFGQNERMAWGVVNANVSLQDLYVERFNPNNPLQFDDRGEWQDAVRFREVIRVRGGRPHVEDVLVTRRGPVISPAIAGSQPPMSLRWVGFDSEIDSISWARRLNLATDWKSFRAAVSSCAAPALGVTYADVDGNIGYRLSGFIPLRRRGQGRVPSRGWEPLDEWAGFVAMEDMPEVLNPDSGQVVAANQPVATGSAAPVVEEPAGVYRAARIEEELVSRAKAGSEFCAGLQGDVLSLAAVRFREIVAEAAQRDGDTRAGGALELLRAWDGRLDDTSGAAALYEVALRHLFVELVGRRLSPSLERYLLGAGATEIFPDGPYSGRLTPGLLGVLAEVVRSGKAAGTDATSDVLWTCLERAWSDLVERQGTDPARWRLSRFREFRLEHPLAAAFGALRPLLSRGPLRGAGDADTVRVGSISGSEAGRAQLTAAFYRAVYDLGDRARSSWSAVPGQSGHPASGNYADTLNGWLEVRLDPFPAQGAPQGTELRLEPRPG